MSLLPTASPLSEGWAPLLALAPLLLVGGVLLLGFVKASVVLALLRQALGGVPPAPLAALLALLLSGFAMAPLAERSHAAMANVPTPTVTRPPPGPPPSPPPIPGGTPARPSAGQPTTPAPTPSMGEHPEAGLAEARLEAGLRPVREFLLQKTPQRDQLAVADLTMRLHPGSSVGPGTPPSTPALLLAFVLAELRIAFLFSFVLLLPFLLIDLLAASLISGLALPGLSARGIALPCKLLLFVACDGWQLLGRSLLWAYAGADGGAAGGTP